MSKGWCTGHSVPESVCTRCDDSLVEKFKAAGDWCGEHGLPESQCVKCHPEVKAKWEAINPANKGGDARAPSTEKLASVDGGSQSGMTLEPSGRLVTGANDPLCPVDQLRVRLRDAAMMDRAGIRTEPAAPRRINAVVEAPGEVEFDATRVTRVTPRIGGTVLEVPATLGAQVSRGDLLAVIDSPALGEAKSRWIELREGFLLAESDAQRARAIHSAAMRMLDLVQADASADDVRRQAGELAVGEAKGRLLRAHAELVLARAVEVRETRLSETGIGSGQSLEAARSELAAAEAEFHAAHEEIAFTVERERIAAERALTVARSALDAAERRLHLLGVDQAAIAALGSESHEKLSRYELRSPAEGTVVERGIVVGEAVSESDAAFLVADLASMWIEMDAREADLPVLRVGLPVIFTVDGLPGRSFEGKVAWIGMQVDDRTRAVPVRADVPNVDGLLRAKMFGRGRIVLGGDDDAVSVPVDAVQTDGCCQLLFVQHDGYVFEPRKVVLGREANGYVEITNGLRAGEAVATSGSFLMKTEILKGNIGAGCCDVDPGR
jgi:cobalt-zinc-cadmium efflux system membrane fusion protein